MILSREQFDAFGRAIPRRTVDIPHLGEVQVLSMTGAQRLDAGKGTISELDLIASNVEIFGERFPREHWDSVFSNLPTTVIGELVRAIIDFSEVANAKKS